MTAILDMKSKKEIKKKKKKRDIERENTNTFILLHKCIVIDSSVEKKQAIQTLSKMLKMSAKLNACIALPQELLQGKPNYISEL